MKKIAQTLLFVLISAFVFESRGFAQQDAVIEVTLRSRLSTYGNDTPIVVDFLLTNRSSISIRVLRWTTPIEGVSADLFLVARGSQPIQYIGRLVKRGPPTEDDFITVAPGETVSAPVDISLYYAIYEAGNYTVTYDTEGSGVLIGSPDALIRASVLSNAAVFRLLAGRIPPEFVPLSTTKFDQCDSAQQDDLNIALAEARNISSSALQALQVTPPAQQPGSQRYLTWFGVHSDALYSKVVGNFSKISDALANKQITFGCNGSECEPIDFAYVYPLQPYAVFVCNKFWLAPVLGTDSRSGTIVHEISHFGVVVGTKDYAYGHGDSKALAVVNPPRATSNADSHEYFAENEPQLPM
jgi:peptidyl-Lys metalloendopeptidase